MASGLRGGGSGTYYMELFANMPLIFALKRKKCFTWDLARIDFWIKMGPWAAVLRSMFSPYTLYTRLEHFVF